LKLLLVYPPLCTPTVPPYSITYLESFITANSDLDVKCLDLNAKFHRQKFGAMYKGLAKAKNDPISYSELLEKYSSKAKKINKDNSVNGEVDSEAFAALLELILKERPDTVGFSLVYNSQLFYGLRLVAELTKNGVSCVVGGPAAPEFIEETVKVLDDEFELLKYLTKREKYTESYALDFCGYPEEDYLSKEMIYPVRSSYGCCHRKCAFCTHHGNAPYKEIDLKEIKETIQKNKVKNLFFIDDTISAKRLSELAEMLAPLGVRWWCQTRPTRDLLGLFKKLRESGLVSISFGVESGNQTILDAMRKGTNVEDIKKVLSESHAAGIKNIVFIMFGFPGEDESSLTETMNLLRDNGESIDIVSASVFGLQRGSHVYDNPCEFGVYDICEHRTSFGESVDYKVRAGLSEQQAKRMKENLAKEIRAMNKLPKIFCLLKEQSLFF
jgi:hypothetical protein